MDAFGSGAAAKGEVVGFLGPEGFLLLQRVLLLPNFLLYLIQFLQLGS